MSNKVLIIIILVLLGTNLAMLWNFTRTPKDEVKPKSKNERTSEFMKKELNFNDAQVQQYLQIRSLRDSLIQPLNIDLRKAKLLLLEKLHQKEIADSQLQLLAQDVGYKQAMIEMEYFRHFQRLQNICQPEQLPLLDSMLVRMVRRNTGDTTAYANQKN